jgi:IS1 family transposase
MNKLSTPKRIAVISALVEGNSIASTCRMTGIAKMTVLKLLADVGAACAHLQDTWMMNLPCKRIQVDEIWSFCGMKAKNVPYERRGTFGVGDVWTFVAIDAETKLVPAWKIGPRSSATAEEFMFDLALRLRNRVQLTTDGFAPYVQAVERAFASDSVDYGMLVKHYNEATREDRRRYSPARFVSATLTPIFGEPDEKHISTSYIERQNLNIRMSNRRMTRLTNGFSKKVENHAHQLAINFAHHNFVRVHGALRCTPAMAAEIVSTVWSVADLVKIADEYEITQAWDLAKAS